MKIVPSSWMSIWAPVSAWMRADDLTAGPDDVADLVGRDLDGDDARSVLAHLLARNLDRLHHLAQDEGAAFLGLHQRGAQDVDRQALGLVVHLHRRDAVLGTRDLEVHVAEEVLEALDVGQDGDVVTLLDEPHRDTGDGCRDRNAGVHERERSSRRPSPSSWSRWTRAPRTRCGWCTGTRPRRG